MAIRYDKKLSRELARTVRNFNAKVRRLERLERELIPSRVSVASLKDEFTDRKELQRRLRELQGFSKRGAEDIITTSGGVRTTRYEFKLTKERARIAKIRLSREIRILGEATPTVYGKKQPRKFVEMGSEELSNLQARRKSLDKDINRLDKQQYEQYRKRADYEYQSWQFDKRQGKFFRSYMDILEKAAYMAGVPYEYVVHIQEALSKLSMAGFGRLMGLERAFKSIIDYYVVLKVQSGVLSTDDEAQLRDIFEELNSNIDEMVEQYA